MASGVDDVALLPAMSRLLPPAALTAILLLAPGCARDSVATYRVPKEVAPAPTAPASMDAAAADAAMRSTPVPTSTGPGLAWTAPAHWRNGGERTMRVATLIVPGRDGSADGEISVTAFPGDVGGNLANVNRWRQQLGLPPISEAELGATLQHLDVGSLHVDVVELVGPGQPPAQRVLGAIAPYGTSTWFFKFTGPDALVAAERDTFLAFIRTLRPQG